MTTTTVHELPAQPTGLPTKVTCSCGLNEFAGVDTPALRWMIKDHLNLSRMHGKTYRGE